MATEVIATCILKRALSAMAFYLAAESLGLGATGIGAFYDDEVNHYLNVAPADGQVVYHFAIGYPVPDPRISGSGTRFTARVGT